MGQDQHQVVEEKNSNRSSAWQAYANTLGWLEGTSIVALPYAVKRGGYPAIVVILLMPIAAYYTGKILIDCLYEGEKRNTRWVRVRDTYADIGEACWANHGRKMVCLNQALYGFMYGTSLLVLSGSFLDNAFPSTSLSVSWWTVIATTVLLPTVLFKHLSTVSWVAVMSNVALVSAVTTVMVFCLKESTSWQVGSIPGWKTEGVFFSVPLITLGYDCHALLPFVEDSMANRSRFNQVLGLSFATSLVIKVVFAVCCFLTFEQSTKEAVINNLPQGVLRYTACGLLALSIVCNYSQDVFVIIEVLNESFTPKFLFATKAREILWSVVSRLLVVFLTLAGALIIPNFAVITAIPGSIFGTLVAFTLPCCFHLYLKHDQLRWFSVTVHIFILILSTICGFLGIFFSLKKLIQIYST